MSKIAQRVLSRSASKAEPLFRHTNKQDGVEGRVFEHTGSGGGYRLRATGDREVPNCNNNLGMTDMELLVEGMRRIKHLLTKLPQDPTPQDQFCTLFGINGWCDLVLGQIDGASPQPLSEEQQAYALVVTQRIAEREAKK